MNITSTYLPPEAAGRIHGALLVAPADPERRAVMADFAPVPYQPLPYPSMVVASAYARAWANEFVRLQNLGHINTESSHGD